MSEAAAFQGSYSDMKFIKSRSVVQIVIELPIEQAAAFVAAFGAPDPAKECPVALARLDIAKPAQEPAKAKKAWADLPPSQQAAIRCEEGAFQTYVTHVMRIERQHMPDDESPSDRATRYIRKVCGVRSRSEIYAGSEAEKDWRMIERAYAGWLREPA